MNNKNKSKTIKVVAKKNSQTNSPIKKSSFQTILTWCKSPYFLAAITLFLTVLATMYPIVTDHMEGKFSGRLVVGIGSDIPLDPDSTNYIFYSVPSAERGERYLVPIDLTVLNDSKKSDSAVSLSIEFDKVSNRLVFPEEAMKKGGARLRKDVSHELSSANDHDYSNYRIDFLSPEDSVHFTEGGLSTSVPPATQMKPLLATDAGMNVKVRTYSHNDKPRAWDLQLRGIHVHSIEAFNAWMQRWYAAQLAIEIREKSGFWEYFYRILSSRDIVVYWFAPDFKLIEPLSLYVPQTNGYQYKGFKFNPYVWSLLFDFQ